MATSSTGYIVGGSGPGPNASPDEQPEGELWDLARCRKAYAVYLDSKRLEIQEQQTARRYRHGVQWTAEQIKTLNERKQPIVTYNRIGRKIDGIVGLVERLKQDPKAYPRTPQHQQGADLATAVLRYLMDSNRWEEKASTVAEAAAIDGLAGIELDLEDAPPPKPQPQMPPQTPQMPPQTPQTPQMGGQMGGMPPDTPDGWQCRAVSRHVRQRGRNTTATARQRRGVQRRGQRRILLRPRSYKNDFSDARYLGMGKFVDKEMLLELMPQFADQLQGSGNIDLDLTSGSDRDNRWFQHGTDLQQLRLVDIWYRHQRGWCWRCSPATRS